MHSDNRLGTVQRLQRRMKGLAVRVISTSPVTWVRERSGDIRLVAPHMMKPPAAPMQAPAKTSKAPAKTSKAPAKTSKADPNARPGLGFKPLYDIGEQYGVGVDYPIPGGAADKAGIKSGDIIISLGGEELQDIEHYTEVLAEQTVGKKVKVVVLRDKKKMPLEVVIGVSGR